MQGAPAWWMYDLTAFHRQRVSEILLNAHSEASAFCVKTVHSLITSLKMYMSLVFFIVLFRASVCGELADSPHNSSITYDPSKLLIKIFNLDSSQAQPRTAFRFDGESGEVNSGKTQDGFVNFDRDEESPFKTTVNFNSDDSIDPQYANKDNNDQGYRLTFIEDNRVHEGHQKKRRRRKPRLQRPQGLGPEYHGQYSPSVLQVGPSPYLNPGYPGPIYRPPMRRRPSLASEALSSVTEALTSVALYDDKQCVARLLCEAASGGALGASQALQSIAGLQPLLTLLSAYSGITSNPLFVFGRAAFLGMSSKNNAASCRYAYPLCPTDPEQLVYYLNNYNGGFFRFFNAPQRGQQNIDQFYHQLSQDHEIHQQGSPFLQNNVVFNNINRLHQQNEDQDPTGNYGNYGTNFPYKHDKYGLLNNIKFKNNEKFAINGTVRIEQRIQNIPEKYLQDFEDDLFIENTNYNNAKWSFPETNNDLIQNNNIRANKDLKFPENQNDNVEEVEDTKRNPRGFVFPGTLYDQYTEYHEHRAIDPLPHNKYNYVDYNELNHDIREHYNNNRNGYDKDQSIRTVYVVRGNGDPNHPEIIKLRPGQAVY